jgi:hypothetical protein
MPQNSIKFGNIGFILGRLGAAWAYLPIQPQKIAPGERPINGAKIHFRKGKTSISKLVDGRLSPEWSFLRFSRISAYFSRRWVYFPDFALLQSIFADFGQLQLSPVIESVIPMLEEA